MANATTDLFDVVGNQVAHYALPANANIVTENVGSLAAGIYLYKISFNNNVLKRGKLIITK